MKLPEAYPEGRRLLRGRYTEFVEIHTMLAASIGCDTKVKELLFLTTEGRHSVMSICCKGS